jgi:hypothetical protein
MLKISEEDRKKRCTTLGTDLLKSLIAEESMSEVIKQLKRDFSFSTSETKQNVHGSGDVNFDISTVTTDVEVIMSKIRELYENSPTVSLTEIRELGFIAGCSLLYPDVVDISKKILRYTPGGKNDSENARMLAPLALLFQIAKVNILRCTEPYKLFLKMWFADETNEYKKIVDFDYETLDSTRAKAVIVQASVYVTGNSVPVKVYRARKMIDKQYEPLLTVDINDVDIYNLITIVRYIQHRYTKLLQYQTGVAARHTDKDVGISSWQQFTGKGDRRFFSGPVRRKIHQVKTDDIVGCLKYIQTKRGMTDNVILPYADEQVDVGDSTFLGFWDVHVDASEPAFTYFHSENNENVAEVAQEHLLPEFITNGTTWKTSSGTECNVDTNYYEKKEELSKSIEYFLQTAFVVVDGEPAEKHVKYNIMVDVQARLWELLEFDCLKELKDCVVQTITNGDMLKAVAQQLNEQPVVCRIMQVIHKGSILVPLERGIGNEMFAYWEFAVAPMLVAMGIKNNSPWDKGSFIKSRNGTLMQPSGHTLLYSGLLWNYWDTIFPAYIHCGCKGRYTKNLWTISWLFVVSGTTKWLLGHTRYLSDGSTPMFWEPNKLAVVVETDSDRSNYLTQKNWVAVDSHQGMSTYTPKCQITWPIESICTNMTDVITCESK